MRIRIWAHVLLLIFVVMAPSVRAEFLPWNIPVNSSFRVGYLYGSQVVMDLLGLRFWIGEERR